MRRRSRVINRAYGDGSGEGAFQLASVLIVGAGIGGIAAAARLAQRGCRVTVVEKCDRPGGRCGRLSLRGHRFDTGATFFLMPEIYAQTFRDLGERIEDHLELKRVDPAHRIHFNDGTTLSLTSDLNAMQAQLEAIEPGSFGAYLRYLSEAHRHYALSMKHLVCRGFEQPWDYFNFKNLLLFFRLKALSRHFDHMRHFFDDDRLKIAFTFQNLYMGLSPFEAPAIFSLLQYSEQAEGVWLPIGGMYRVIEALTEIARRSGVRFLYHAPVERILVRGEQATGVALADGRRLLADLIVANADLPYVYRALLPPDGTSQRLERKRYGCSTVMFYWGLDRRYPQFGPHNLYIAEKYREGFDAIFRDLSLPEEPSFYVHAPASLDPSSAPEGQDSLIVAVPVGHLCREAQQEWDGVQARAREAVLARLAAFGIPDLEAHIKFEVSFDPSDWRSRFNLVRGSTHGLSHNLMQMGYLRPHNRHQRYRNLYFVGASTHPGTGMPTVLVSARLAVERILREAGPRLDLRRNGG